MTAVSVIIPTFNRAQKVRRAISSVLFQTFRDYEIIVVDDGSTDETSLSLAPFRTHIRHLAHPKNLGVSAARNTGIRASKGPLIAFLDSDDYWLPEKLALQVAFFESRPEVLACQTQEHWIRKGVRVNPGKKHLKPSGEIFDASLKLCLVSPSAVMLKRSLLDEVGLFDEALPVCEDYDLWLRTSSRYPIHLIETALVVKEGGAPDQLSHSLEGMDRFRITAIARLIEGGRLTEGQAHAAFKEITRKCRIYGAGCIKRGKKEEGEDYLQLPNRITRPLMRQQETSS